jgi:RNA-directed DNA polymerase
MQVAPEPKDKLGAMTNALPAASAVQVAAVVANGPEDEPTDWSSINWRQVEDDVRRLRQRIFAAARNEDLRQVRNLQRLMLRSRSNALLSVRRVTEVNAGRMTAGVDGTIVLLPQQKAGLAAAVRGVDQPPPLPVKRVYIPKRGSTGKRRPLGIPVIRDRARQAVVLNALEPEWEARFEPKSYGFRPGRGCHDAIETIFATVVGRNPHRRTILDADLAAAFDRIDHEYLLRLLGTFPARGEIAGWLRAGVVERGRFTATDEGTPQGGVISPVLLNVALHGLETAAGSRYTPQTHRRPGRAVPGTPVVVRYADDLVALCNDIEHAQRVKDALTGWLAPRGLTFNEDKTRIVSLEDGFDFLGFNIRRYPNGKLLIKPSRDAVRRIRRRLAAEVKALHGANAEAVITKLNPIIRGWAAYYRTVVSKEIFSALDHYVWVLTYRWARRAHPNKGKRWVKARYFAAFHPSRKDRWVFGDRATGRYLVKFSWTPIVRHRLVKGRASVDDPDLADYWARRRRRDPPPLGTFLMRLIRAQNGRCSVCGGLLLDADHPPQHPDEWEQWLKVVRKAIHRTAITAPTGPTDDTARQLMHTHCARRQIRHRAPTGPATNRPPIGACLSRMR